MQVCLITALKIKRYKKEKKLFVFNYFKYFYVDTNTKPRGISTCCVRSIGNPQRACNSLAHHKGFRKYQCTKKKSSFRIGLYQGHGQGFQRV
jgi:hypothetical protein